MVATVVASAVLAGTVALFGGSVDGSSPAFAIAGTLLQDAALIGAAIVIALRYGPVAASDFGLRPVGFRAAAIWTCVAVVGFYGITASYVALVEPQGEQDTLEVLGADRGGAYLFAAAALVILVAPVAEEVFFRGFFYRSLRNRLPPLGAAIVVGVVFGAIHYRGSDTLALLPLLAVLGVLFCLLYERTRSLYPAIAMHAVNNAIALSATSDDAAAPVLAALLGAGAVLGCILAPARQGGS